jgi:glyoxylase-like metal-dependent hydrolase (beta-lactamase superfamily II)
MTQTEQVPVERVTPGVLRILAPNPSAMTLDGTNTYLVGRGDIVVVDPGPDLPEHVDAIVAAAQGIGRIRYSAVTHHHADHMPAAYRLRQRQGIAIAGHLELPGVDRPLADGELLTCGGLDLRALWTAGHTDDHVCYFLAGDRAVFTGDLIAGRGTVVVGSGQSDLARYLDSLERVGELDAETLLPGHGPVVRDPAAKVREYVEHRVERERQVLRALEDGPLSVDQIVGTVYTDLAEQLVPMASRNVQAHLFKLRLEGRVRILESSGRWCLVDEDATS